MEMNAMNLIADIPYVKNGCSQQLLDIYLPDSDQFSTLIWFHGGSLESGSRKRPEYAQVLTAAGYGFVSVDYRIYPDARFPDFIEDAAAAVAWVLKNIGQYGGNGEIFVSGESAGAYLTMMLCMDEHYLLQHGVSQTQIAGFLSDSAQQFCHFNVLRELGLDSRLERIDFHAPIYFLRPEMELRPLLLLYYENDLVCRPEETRLMYASLKNLLPESDVHIAKLPGSHCCFPKDSQGNNMMLLEFLKFINQHTSR